MLTERSSLAQVLNDNLLAAYTDILTYTLDPLLKLIVTTREFGWKSPLSYFILLKVISLDNTPNAIASDTNDDGNINSADLLKIQKKLLGVTEITL